ncbi:hypothetical protein [Klebsiella phage 05F01]|nr:hypothetical protein [Klebsiella phage 05F01]
MLGSPHPLSDLWWATLHKCFISSQRIIRRIN